MAHVKEHKVIALPALRGVMGTWVYYSCLMDMDEIAKRIQYAEDIHKNKNLSDMIQRQLKRGRSDQIAEYLKGQDERFFNSLVIATYGGEPSWHEMSDIRSKSNQVELQNLKKETIESIGFLTLRGDERLFALDGQHRLAGIKKVVREGVDQDSIDQISVIFVGHKDTKKGFEKTRRLFTTLNKTAKPVSKGDIIALDEDDVMAICVRRLIEETNMFTGDRIAFVASNNIPVNNTTCLTTIVNMYDILTILFADVSSSLKKSRADLKRVRPDDELLDEYFTYAKKLFRLLKKNFKELDEFFSAENSGTIAEKYRGSHGGNALFRPIGLEVLMKVIARLSKDMPLSDAVKQVAKLPVDLNAAPYEWLMWDPHKKTIINAHKATLRESLLHMLGKSKHKDKTLLEKYRNDTGSDDAELPDRII
ncbi:MAG: DGQHR domain-containing protein [Candidatus Thiodiazotropha sp. (ex Codakia orbicularis)]|nr:DGQHR domain-containing protein [Candidatus Thiodiazotropha sp. (ex Codakia orbicularis)]